MGVKVLNRIKGVVIFSWTILFLSMFIFVRKIYFTSDSLFLDDLFDDIFHRGGDFIGWRFTASPAFIPDVLLYFISALIYRDVLIDSMIVNIFQAFSLALISVLLVFQRAKEKSALTYAFVFSMISILNVSAGTSGMWMYFSTTNNHMPCTIFALISLFFVTDFLESLRKRSLFYFFVASFFGVFSSPLFLVTFVPSVFVLVAFLVAINLKSHRFQLSPLFLCIGVSVATALALLCDKMIIVYPVLGMRTGFDPVRAAAGFQEYLKAEISIWKAGYISFYVIYGFAISGFLASVLYFLPSNSPASVLENKNRNKCEHFEIGFIIPAMAIISTIVTFSVSILSGGYADSLGHRYFILPGFLCGIALISEISILKKKYDNAVNAIFLLILMLSAGFVLSALYRMVVSGEFMGILKENHKIEGDFGDSVKCFTEVHQKYNLHSGMTNYWVARRANYSSDYKLGLTSVASGLWPFFWMNSVRDYFPKSDNGIYKKYDYVIFDSQDKAFNVNEETSITTGIKFSNIISCGNQYKVAISDNGDLDRLAHRNFFVSMLIGNISGTSRAPASSLQSQVGDLVGHFRRSNGTAGMLIYGPYVSLNPGKYSVSFSYDFDGSPEDADLSFVDVGRFGGEPPLGAFGKKKIIPGSHIETISFSLDKPIAPGEFRIFYGGRGILTAKEISVTYKAR